MIYAEDGVSTVNLNGVRNGDPVKRDVCKLSSSDNNNERSCTSSLSSSNSSNCSGKENFDMVDSLDEDSDGKIKGVLSRSLMNLSLLDRNAIFEEIHGVRCMAIKETPELIERSLHKFQMELDRDKESGNENTGKVYHILRKRREQESPSSSAANSSSNRDGKNYNFRNYNYAMDDDGFRLRFLRCELFDVKKAVVRFCNYLDYAYEFWGEVALKRPIRLEDFTKTDLKLFRKGYFQLLPFRDSSGRRVMVFLGGTKAHEDTYSRDKLLFYFWDVVTRDSIESQQKGFIMVRMIGNRSKDKEKFENDSQSTSRISSESFRSYNRIFSSIPSRIVAMHTSVPNHPVYRLVLKIVILKALSVQNAHLRPRFILHERNSDVEFRYRLKSYGIPTLFFPLTDTNSIKCTYFNQWVRTRKILEYKEFGMTDRNDVNALRTCESDIQNERSDFKCMGTDDAYIAAAAAENGTIVECPASTDVVFRKGSRVTSIENPGNRFFRDLIRTFLEEKERTMEQLRREELFAEETIVSDHVGSSLDGDFSTTGTTAQFTKSPTVASVSPLDNLSQEATTATSAQTGGKKNTGKAFCDWLIDYIEQECNGRFLEWNTKLTGWIVMKDPILITRKVTITMYNWGKLISAKMASAKQQQQDRPSNNTDPPLVSVVPDWNSRSVIYGSSSNNVNNNITHIDNGTCGVGDDSDFYSLIDARRRLSTGQEQPFLSPLSNWNAYKSGKKRERPDDPSLFSCIKSPFRF